MRVTPSDLIGLTSSVKRFYFDRGIWHFGSRVENAISQAEEAARKTRGKKSKVNTAMVNLARQQALDKMLKLEGKKSTQKFKDPALNFKGPQKGKSGGQDSLNMSDDRNEVELGAEFLG